MTSSIAERTTDQMEAERLVEAVRASERLLAMGRIVEAEQVAKDRLDGHCGTDSEVVVKLRLLLARCCFLTRRHREAIAQLDQILHATGVPASLCSEAQLARLRALLSAGDAAAVFRSTEQLLGGGDDSVDDAVLPGALVATGVMAWDSGRVSEAVSYLRAANARSHRRCSFDTYDLPSIYLAATLTSVGEFTEAERLLAEALHLTLHSDDAILAAWVHAHFARLALALGKTGPAAAHAEAALGISSEAGASYYDGLVTSVLASIALAEGDISEAERLAGAGRARSAPDVSVLGWAASRWLEVDLAESVGGRAQALDILNASLDRPQWRTRLLLERPQGAAWWVQAALSAGEPQSAAVVARAIEELATSNPGSSTLAGSYLHARGVYSRDVETLDRALALYRHPWARASVQEDAASMALRVRRPDAKQRLEAARRAYVDVGGSRAVDRIDRWLRDLTSRRHRYPGRQCSWGWDGLTEAERRVAFAVAGGRTNAKAAEHLCLSRHTVDFHLRQVFRKLGIASRVELARLVALDDGTAVLHLFHPTHDLHPTQAAGGDASSPGLLRGGQRA